jgi:SSS family solute:Na+ symporter
MQFGILFLGAMVFAFYQFRTPPIFFNPVQTAKVLASAEGGRFAALQQRYREVAGVREQSALELVRAMRSKDAQARSQAERAFTAAGVEADATRKQAIGLIRANDPSADLSDTNYVFLSFVVRHLPAGLVGLVLAAVFAASMSASSAELNALASTTVVDVYRRLINPRAGSRRYVLVSRLATLFWGLFAIAFAQQASRLGSLVEAVNILGSLFYGTILGIFLVGFYVRRVSGTAVFVAAIFAEAAVVACYALTAISFLWYNVVGCVAVVLLAAVLEPALRRTVPGASTPA